MILHVLTGLWTAYLTYVVIKFGVQPSISLSIYSWPHTNKKPWTDRLILMLLLIVTGVSFPILVPHWSGFIAGAGLVLVGVAGDYRGNKSTTIAHVGGSFIGIVAAVLSLWLTEGEWRYFVFFMAFAGISGFVKYKNYTWWVEVMALALVLISLYDR